MEEKIDARQIKKIRLEAHSVINKAESFILISESGAIIACNEKYPSHVVVSGAMVGASEFMKAVTMGIGYMGVSIRENYDLIQSLQKDQK